MTASLILLLAALVASAFFSGMEIAFLSANRLQVEIEAKKGERRWTLVALVLPSFYGFYSYHAFGKYGGLGFGR